METPKRSKVADGDEVSSIEAQAPLLCPWCFKDLGLRYEAHLRASESVASCPNCSTPKVQALTRTALLDLSSTFFVRGSTHKTTFGGAPILQINESNTTGADLTGPVAEDVKLLERKLRIKVFRYGPRLWMLGHIEPLDALNEGASRDAVIERILREYPVVIIDSDTQFYRVRKAPDHPDVDAEYDAPPLGVGKGGRLDTPSSPVLYGSQDLEICVHECRFSAEDTLYVGVLAPKRSLKLLDLTAVLEEIGSEFESLDLAVHMLFLAGSHTYPITRAIAAAASAAGFDGLLYTSYFSLLRTGAPALETVWGMSLRMFAEAAEYEKSKLITNIALFGRPINAGDIEVIGKNKLVISRVLYDFNMGPVISF